MLEETLWLPRKEEAFQLLPVLDRLPRSTPRDLRSKRRRQVPATHRICWRIYLNTDTRRVVVRPPTLSLTKYTPDARGASS